MQSKKKGFTLFIPKQSEVRSEATKGFTLLELMIVMVILGVLATFLTGNFFTSLNKSRDARRKADLQNTQRALELYYEDHKAYPLTNIFDPVNGKFCSSGVISSGSDCPSGENTYMQKIPADPQASKHYYYTSTGGLGADYKIYSCIENDQDQGPGVQQAGYSGTDCGICKECKFGISSSNTSP